MSQIRIAQIETQYSTQLNLAISFFADVSVLNCDVQALCNLPEKVIKAKSRRRDYFACIYH